MTCNFEKGAIDWYESVKEKRELFQKNLTHPKIKKIHGIGLMLAIEFENEKVCQDIVKKTLNNGVITFYFLFDRKNMRISPPLTISKEEIIESCKINHQTLDQ